MDLAGVRVLLVADDPATLDRVGGYLSKAGATPQVTSRTAGLCAAADCCDIAVLLDDFGEPEEFDVCLAPLRRSKAALLIVTERAGLGQWAARAGILLAPSRLVRGWSLLEAIRARVCTAPQPSLVDSTPELPFTD